MFSAFQRCCKECTCCLVVVLVLVLSAPVGRTETANHTEDVTYSSAIQRLTANLAAAIDIETKQFRRGDNSLSIGIIPDGLNNDFRWNSFVDRIINELQNQLSLLGFQAYSILQSTAQADTCSENHPNSNENDSGTDITGYLTITPYHHQKEVRVTVSLRGTNPLSVFSESFHSQVTSLLGQKYYKTAYREMQESFIPAGYHKGSKINPFEDERMAAQSMADIFLCKLDKATPAWNNSRKNAERVDFKKLHYRFAELKPGSGVSHETANQIGQAIYRQLARYGLNINANANDLGKVLDHVEMYADLPRVYLNSDEAGKVQLVPSEAIILGDVIRDGKAASRLLVSIRAVITSQSIGGKPSQGFVIPSLSTYSYIVDQEASKTSIDTVRLFYDASGADALPESSPAVTAILKGLKRGLQQKGFVFQKSMGQLTENNVIMNITVELGPPENVTNKFCVSNIIVSAIFVSAIEQRQLASAQASQEIVGKCGRKIAGDKLRRDGRKIVGDITDDIWEQLQDY